MVVKGKDATKVLKELLADQKEKKFHKKRNI
jgi:hypothetical protein